MIIAEIRLEKSSFSEDTVQSKSIAKEVFEGKMFFKSNVCSCAHEGDESIILNSLKVDSNLKSFRWMNFDSNESSEIEVEHEWRDEIEVSELEWSFFLSIEGTDEMD